MLNRGKWRPAVHAFGDTDNRINFARGEVASARGWMTKFPDVHRHDDPGPEAARKSLAPPISAGVESFIAHDAPDDAGWLFTEERGKHFAGVSLWNIKTGENRRVHALADPQRFQGGGFDGRYLVWEESKWSKSFDLFSVYSFDLHTGKVTKLADSTRDAKGVTYPMQLADPVISDGMVAWAQGVGPGVSAVKLVDLRTGHFRTARQSPIGARHFVGMCLSLPNSPVKDSTWSPLMCSH